MFGQRIKLFFKKNFKSTVKTKLYQCDKKSEICFHLLRSCVQIGHPIFKKKLFAYFV